MYELIEIMKIHHGFNALKLTDPVITLGIFDGVHTGHMAIIKRLVSYAQEIKGESVVITFDPHPRMILDNHPERLFFLSSMDEKKTLLASTGIDHLIINEFNREFSRITAREFVNDILAAKLGTRYMIVGHDHHFGHGGTGNYNTIREYALKAGIIIVQVAGIESEGTAISSSRIRDALLSGRLNDANKWLGYNYSLQGIVVRGRGIGSRKLGFPTANIEPLCRNKLIPANGVYAVEVLIDDDKLPGMLSIVTNPTVSQDQVVISVEVHIFNFSKNIYGSKLQIVFRYRLRDEIKFSSTDELSRQLKNDMAYTMKLLG